MAQHSLVDKCTAEIATSDCVISGISCVYREGSVAKRNVLSRSLFTKGNVDYSEKTKTLCMHHDRIERSYCSPCHLLFIVDIFHEESDRLRRSAQLLRPRAIVLAIHAVARLASVDAERPVSPARWLLQEVVCDRRVSLFAWLGWVYGDTNWPLAMLTNRFQSYKMIIQAHRIPTFEA